MHDEIKVRLMVEQDIDAVARLEKECFSSPWSKASLRESLSQPYVVFVVATVEEKVVGYGGIYIVNDDGEITNIAVTGSMRGRGVGKMLLEKINEECEKRQVKAIVLEVRESNEVAIRLYEKMGYSRIGIRKNFYDKPRENALIMWKKSK